MKRYALLLLVLAALLVGAVPQAAVAASSAKAAASSGKAATATLADGKLRTYTDKGHPDRVVTATGKVFEGVNIVRERMLPEVTTAATTAFRKMGYVEDQAIWNGATDGYNYEFFVRADIGWQAQPDGTYDMGGPYQYRQQPACYRINRSTGASAGTNCNFQFNFSALEGKPCGAPESCSIDVPWGTRDFYQANVTSVLFAGGWHNASVAGYYSGSALMSYTGDATARFLVPNHVTRIYCTGSFWWTIAPYPQYNQIGSDYCSGMRAIS